MDSLREVELTPEEMFYIGKKTGGKYLDYEYVAPMKDIGARGKLRTREILDGLEKKGYAQEDFFGNLSLNQAVLQLVSPVYNGGYESELLVRQLDGQSIIRYKFHIAVDGMVSVVCLPSAFCIRKTDKNEMHRLLLEAVGKDALFGELPTEITAAYADQYIILKSTRIGLDDSLFLYGIKDGIIYEPDDSTDQRKSMHQIDRQTFFDQAIQILSGD